jgi:hypothetical protein
MRRTPFDVAFGPEAETWFPRIRASLAAARLDPHDAEAFILDREVVTYLRELVPEEGVGQAVAQHVALLHHAYLYWDEGGWIFRLAKDRARTLLLPSGSGPAAVEGGPVVTPPRAYYVQFPERLVWGELAPDEPPTPLDGAFIRPWPAGGYFVLAIFGMHPGHAGFSVVDADGYPEGELLREDGTALFGPMLPGGAAAGLYSIVGAEELLELAARTVPLASEARACAATTHRPHHIVEIG